MDNLHTYRRYLPFDMIVDLISDSFEPWKWASFTKPTPNSLEVIRDKLHIDIPEVYFKFVQSCAYVGALHSSLGENYDDPSHIISMNRFWHQAGLPERYVIFNLGFDGDCDCWDTDSAAYGDFKIVHVAILNDGQVKAPQDIAINTMDYLDQNARYALQGCKNKMLKNRAMQLLAEFEDHRTE